MAEVPFDAAYKLMATFHQMTDDDGRRSSAPSSKARRTTPGPRGQCLVPEASDVPIDDVRDRFLVENERLGEQGLRVMAVAPPDFDPRPSTPTGDMCHW